MDIHDPMVYDVLAVLKRIKDGGESKEVIKKIRGLKKKDQRDGLKKRLPSICFSGRFSQRGAKYLLEHSGLICLDIDGIVPNDMDAIRTNIEGDDYTMACFTSPSGNGYKIIIKIPPEKSEHKGLFLALEKYYNAILGRYKVDQSGKDVSRVCFESYDPFMFHNPDSEVWAEVVTEEVSENSLIDQDRIIELLRIWMDKKDNYSKGNRNNYLTTFAYALCRYGVVEHKAKEYLSNQFNDYPAKELNASIRSCYQKEVFNSKQFTEKEMTSTAKRMEPKVEDNKTVIDFWNINDKGRVKIDTKRFLQFVEAHGFGIYRHKDAVKGWDFVRTNNMIVDIVDVIDIKKVVLTYVEKHAPEPVFDELQMVNRYFDKTFLNGLKWINVQQVRDTPDTCYIFFEGFYYEITKKGPVKKDYIDLKGIHIWRKQICKKTITKVVDYRDFAFNRFVYNAMGQSAKKYRNACSALGYSIHTYKKYSQAKLVYMYEESMEELDGMANGGSGKNLLQMCLKYVRSCVHVDGKAFDKKDKFAFQSIDLDTQLIFIDDYEGNIRELFNKITGEFSIEKKGMALINLTFEDSPKIIANSNQGPKGFSTSYARRLHTVEFSDHYNHENTPAAEFNGVDFFSHAWGELEYNMLYSFLFSCVQMYLSEGLKSSDTDILKEKQLIKNTGRNFAEFWLYYCDLDMSTEQDAGDLIEMYKDQMQDKDIKHNNQWFFHQCRILCGLHGWKYVTKGTGVNRKMMFLKFRSIKKEEL